MRFSGSAANRTAGVGHASGAVQTDKGRLTDRSSPSTVVGGRRRRRPDLSPQTPLLSESHPVPPYWRGMIALSAMIGRIWREWGAGGWAGVSCRRGTQAPDSDVPMPTVILRPWQRAAYEAFRASPDPDFLAVATPGAGKTTFALTCARASLAEEPRTLVVVAPTSHLKVQWSLAAHRLGLQLDPDWSPGDGLARDVHGLVTTYQQIATGNTAAKLAGLVRRRVRHPRRDPPRRPREGLGRRHPYGVRPRRPTTVAVGHAVPQRRRADPVRALRRHRRRRRHGPRRLHLRLRRRAARRRRRPAGVLPAGRRRDGVDHGVRRRDQRQLPGRADQGPDVDAAAHGTEPRRRVDAERARPRQRATPLDPPGPPRRRRPRDRHRPGPRPGHRPPAARSVRHARRRGGQRRPDGIEEDRRVRSQRPAVAGGGADGVGGRRHPTAACRRVRHDHLDRAVLPPGGRPVRPLAGRAAEPEGLRLHPRRSPTANACVRDRRGAPTRPASRWQR